jgi:hypothetical protein
MSSRNTLSQEVSVAQADEQDAELDVEATPELRPAVEQDIQAKVDLDHPDVNPESLTLEAQERMIGRELEIQQTQIRIDRSQDSDRERRSRRVIEGQARERRTELNERAIAGNPLTEHTVDPRARLSQQELAAVNQEADRLAGKLTDWSRPAISRRLAKRVVSGDGLSEAVLSVYDQLWKSGQYMPIGAIGDVNGSEVNISGRLIDLWEPASPKIQQVGLIEDESGQTKVTVWKRSGQPWMEAGERVQIQKAATSWYQGRVSVALTGWSRVQFPERGRYWE